MLSNERFVSKAPESKVAEEKMQKLEKVYKYDGTGKRETETA